MRHPTTHAHAAQTGKDAVDGPSHMEENRQIKFSRQPQLSQEYFLLMFRVVAGHIVVEAGFANGDRRPRPAHFSGNERSQRKERIRTVMAPMPPMPPLPPMVAHGAWQSFDGKAMVMGKCGDGSKTAPIVNREEVDGNKRQHIYMIRCGDTAESKAARLAALKKARVGFM